MKSKKFFAYLLAATMVLGSTVNVLANETTGTGTGTGHLSTEDVVVAELPTSTTAFNFYVDPERLISQSGLLNDTSSGTAITSDAAVNINGVYFATDTNTYSSVSTGVAVEVKNYVDAVISVDVSVASAGAFTMASASNWKSTGDPDVNTSAAVLYLGLGVNTDAAVDIADGDFTTINSTGATVSVDVASQKDNYTIIVSDGAYSLQEGTDPWTTLYFKMRGAVTKSTVADSEAPTVNFTWSFRAKNAAAQVTTPEVTLRNGQAVSVTLAGTSTNRTVTSVSYTLAAGGTGTANAARYTYTPGATSSTFVLDSTWSTNNYAGLPSRATVTITYSDSTTETFILNK